MQWHDDDENFSLPPNFHGRVGECGGVEIIFMAHFNNQRTSEAGERKEIKLRGKQFAQRETPWFMKVTKIYSKAPHAHKLHFSALHIKTPKNQTRC